MAFSDLLERAGGAGRFQVLLALLLSLPVLMMASHNLLQNFTAAIAPHRCRLPLEPKNTGDTGLELPRAQLTHGEPQNGGNASLELPRARLTHGEPKNAGDASLGLPRARLTHGEPQNAGDTGLELPRARLTHGEPKNTGDAGPELPRARLTHGEPKNAGDANPELPRARLTHGQPKNTGDASPELPRARLTHAQPHNGTGDATTATPELLVAWLPHGESCRRFVEPQWGLLEGDGNANNATATNGTAAPDTEPCRDGWIYDRSVFTSTIVTEWDLVCGWRGLREMAQSLYMAGVLVGGIVFGGLSDRFGRRSVLTWCYLQLGVTGTCAAFAPSFSLYCLFRFLSGTAFSGIVLNSVSLSLEWMPTGVRALVGTFMGYCYTVGQFLLAGVAFAVPDWRRLQLVVSLPFFGFFLCSWWLTESARWLLMAGRPQQALRALQKVAKINGRREEGDKLDIETLRSQMQAELRAPRSRHPVLALVRTPRLRRISSCLCFVWFSTSFAYYGLAMDLQGFEVDIYIIQLIFGAVDIPAKLLSILTITYVGRRFTQAATLVLAGLAILANILVPRELRTLRTALAVFGKGSLAASFNCVFLYTGELYPTVIRQTGMGLANTMARLGSITAPLVKIWGEVSPTLPFLIYGAAPVVSGLVASFLPETRDRALPETVEEVEGRTRSQKDEPHDLQVPLQPTQPSGPRGPS